MTRLLAVLVGFMVDEQLNSVATGKDDVSNKVTNVKHNCSSLPVRLSTVMYCTIFHFVGSVSDLHLFSVLLLFLLITQFFLILQWFDAVGWLTGIQPVKVQSNLT